MKYSIEAIATGSRKNAGPTGKKGNLFRLALTAFIIMIAGTLLYPDTFIQVGLRAGPFRISAVALLFVVAAPPVFAYAWSVRGTLKFSAIDAFFLLMVGYMLIRGFAAATNGNELGLDVAFAVYALLAYYGASILGQDSSALRIIILTLAILVTVISFYAILEFILNNNFIYGSLVEEKVPIKSAELHRSGSTLGQPLVLGTILLLIVPLQLFLFYKKTNIYWKAFWGTSLLLSAVALYLSFSKGSWLTAAIILLATLIFFVFNLQNIHGKLKPLIMLITALLIVFLLIVSLSYEEFEFNVFSSDRRAESFNLRLMMWQNAPGVFIDNYLIGVGMWKGGDAVYNVTFEETDDEASGSEFEENRIPVDNLLLTTMVEEGLIGTSLMILTISLIGRQTWSVIRRYGRHSSIVISLAIGMIAVLLNGMTTDTLLILPIMLLFWLFAGLIRSQAELLGQSEDVRYEG